MCEINSGIQPSDQHILEGYLGDPQLSTFSKIYGQKGNEILWFHRSYTGKGLTGKNIPNSAAYLFTFNQDRNQKEVYHGEWQKGRQNEGALLLISEIPDTQNSRSLYTIYKSLYKDQH